MQAVWIDPHAGGNSASPAPTPTVATDDGRAGSVVLIDNGGTSTDALLDASSW